MEGFFRYLMVFLGIILLLLGFIFLVGSAGLLFNIAAGAIMIAVGCMFFIIVYRLEHAKVEQPKLVSQTVKVDLSGEKTLRNLKCMDCGAELSDREIGMISGGIIVKCSYCNSVYELEEKPKW